MKIRKFLREIDRERILRFACVAGLIALALIVWSLLDPRPIPVILAMSVAQGIGTMSFASFLLVVVRDLRPVAAAIEKPQTGEAAKTIASPEITSSE